MASLQLEIRTDIVDLQERDNGLAQRFISIRDALESENSFPHPRPPRPPTVTKDIV